MTIRHNLSPNPKAGTNVTGWGGTALGTGGRVTGLGGFPSGVTTGVHYQGAGYIQTPTASGISAGQQVTLSFYLSNNTGFNESGKTMYLAFTRSAGGDDFSNTTAVSFNTGAVTRLSHTATAPANATGAYLLLDGLNANYDVSAMLAEVGALDTYFDGDSANSSWDGAAQNSASTFDDSVATTTVTSDLDLRWAVRGPVTSDLDARWAVRGSVNSDLDLRWGIGGQVTSDLDVRWRISAAASTDGAQYELSEIFDELAATFDGVTTGDAIGGISQTISAHAEVSGQVQAPAVVFELEDLNWDLDMGGGADGITIVATALVQAQDSVGAQRALWRFLSRRTTSGVGRLKAELEANRDLNGLVSYAHMDRVRRVGEITYNGITYLGAEIIIEVVS